MADDEKQLSAEQWFGRADAFWSASRYLGRDKPAGPMPVVICMAFATEAYLKSLLTIRRTSVPRTHNLHRLFELLPDADRAEIEGRWNKRSLPAVQKALETAPDKFDDPAGLMLALKEAALAFMDWRYLVDGKSYWFLGGFPMEVREFIFELHPEWEANLPDEYGKTRPADGMRSEPSGRAGLSEGKAGAPTRD